MSELKKMSNLAEYSNLLTELKTKIRQAQLKAALSVNQELILLYWQIGNSILIQENKGGWGSKVVEELAKDLKAEFPDMKGFSVRNLKYMRAFAENYKDLSFVQQAVAQIPWGHNCIILDKIKDKQEREFYISESIKNGWSRNVMVHQIESRLYQRQIQADKTHNFKTTLTKTQSDLAHEILKDPYNFDFLSLGEEARERDLENALVEHITKFLLELGAGFAFIGRQYHLEIDKQDFYIDLLFYHTRLHAYVVIELKLGDFKPEYAGKLNFYLSVVDKTLKTTSDKPSIGIILCKNKNKIVAEYALQDMVKPIGVSEYKLTEAIPDNLKGSLPSIEELENELINYDKNGERND
jgi:predicted nuclease of restriction endonuclease-like (RecB) superfamily